MRRLVSRRGLARSGEHSITGKEGPGTIQFAPIIVAFGLLAPIALIAPIGLVRSIRIVPAQTTMRSVIGKLEPDKTFEEHEKIMLRQGVEPR